MTVYGFQPLGDDDPILRGSPLVMGIAKTIAYAHENGHIELTKSGFFKRSFVNWAADKFNWPDYSRDELYQINKVLNEQDFQPLAQIHALLIYLKIGRHYKGTFRLTKKGKALVGRPGEIFGLVAEPYLFDIIHCHYISEIDRVALAWPIVVNILNIEADTGVTLKRAAELLFPVVNSEWIYDPRPSNAYVGVLRPFCWLGLLCEHCPADFHKRDETIFIKTALWRTTLRLPTDDMLKPIMLH
jgi:hypothetical protein